MLVRLPITLAVFISLSALAGADDDLFRDKVAPLLRQRCLRCHQDGEAKGDLSLTSRQALDELGYLDLKDPGASYLLEVITPEDGQAAMPKGQTPLSAAEIATIRTWIAQGAQWPAETKLIPPVVSDRNWWSLRPIKSPAVPKLPNQPRNPVDAFIRAQLLEQNLTPAGPAEPATLIRRVTYDLTGLPPTLAEIDSFVADWQQNSEVAWQHVVDRLLDSPAFGEKWAQHWLDVARYAETHGYDKDKPRENAWPYRDYVIRSFNEDKPYDRFVQEQVAGDVLFPNQPDGVLGLGFLAAGPWDFVGHWEVGEGKLDGRIAKHQDRDEMVSAVFNVFLSTTVQCAQCHHHKFDPVRMEDYYRLHSTLSAIDRADRVYQSPSDSEQERRNQLVTQIAELQREQKQLVDAQQSKLSEKTGGISSRIAELQQKFGKPQQPQFGYHSQITSDPGLTKWVQLDLGQAQQVRQIRIVPAFDNFNSIGAGFGFPVRYRVEGSHDPQFAKDVQLLLDASDEDQSNPLSEAIAIDVAGGPFRYVRITATKLRERRNDFIFALGEVEVFGQDSQDNLAFGATVTSLDSIEARPRWGTRNLTDGIYYPALADDDAAAELSRLTNEKAKTEAELRDPAAEKHLAELQEQIARRNTELQKIPPGKFVYAAASSFVGGGQFRPTGGKPREIHLLKRGDLRAPAERMHSGAPRLWDAAPEVFFETDNWNEGDARAALANYLTASDNPLVWRSIVNRVWLWTFGQALVGSPNDFGRMGQQPTHPELLDYLAAKLRDDPQHSLKSIVRFLVLSETYRQATAYDPDNAERDANNAFLWQANRRRLTAEEFRDSVLSLSGVLRLDDRGGPSFRDFVIEKPQHSPHYEYHLFDPANPVAHRRSVYRFVVRSQPQPLLTVLDCADPSLSVPQREESTTALQALAQWNNRFVEAMSGRFAQRVESEEEPIATAWRLATGREPSAKQLAQLEAYAQQHGLANACRVILNLNAFVYLD